MFTAFSVLFLFLAGVMPAGRISMYFLSSIFVSGLTIEREYLWALLCFIASSLIGLLILPDLLRLVPYVLFFGHYGIGKAYIERIKNKPFAFALKLLYFNVALLLIYLLANSVLTEDLSYIKLPVWAIALIAQIAFAVYDFVYSKVQQVYYEKLRRPLMGKKYGPR